MTFGLAALSASVFAGLDFSRAVGGFVRAPCSPGPVAGRRLRVYLGAHNKSFKPNPLRGSA
jgi:hypothetical protein